MKTVGFQCLFIIWTVFLSGRVPMSEGSPNPKPMLLKLHPEKASSVPLTTSLPVQAPAAADPLLTKKLPLPVNRTRIAQMRPYRIQRKLSPPTSNEVDMRSLEIYMTSSQNTSSNNKIRKPKRKLLHYIPSALSKAGSSSSSSSNVKLKKNASKLDRFADDKLTEKMKAKLKTLLELEEEDIKLNRHSILMHDDSDNNEDYGYLHYPHIKGEGGTKHKHGNYAVDPAHPAVLAITQHNPLAPFKPMPHSNLSHPGLQPQKKKKIEVSASLLPLDKTLLYCGMAFSWVFWLIVALAYFSWGDKYSQLYSQYSDHPMLSILRKKSDQQSLTMSQKPIIVKLEPGKPAQFFQTRALQGGSFNFARVLDMIAMAQETYEKFDFQSIDCQKKALCELQQKQADFGETGRKISSTFSFMDTLEGLPMPAIIQTYLKEYREAIMQGKNSSKECSAIYPKCGFSIKEVFVKYSKKAHKQ